MSASSKKKARKLLEAEAKQTTAKSKMSKGTKETIAVIVIAVVVLAAMAVGMMIYSNQKNKPDYDVSVPAGTVGSESISVPMMNYFYMDAVSSFYNNYGSYIQLFFNPSLPLGAQEFNDSFMGTGKNYATWDEYFIDTAKDSAADTMNMVAAAKAEGMELSSDAKKAIEANMENLDTTATNGGFKDADAYLTALYGPGCDTDNYKEFLSLQYLASDFYSAGMDKIEVTDDEITAAYAEAPADYDRVSYYIYTARPETKTDDEGNTIDPTDEDIAAAAADAAAMKENFEVAKASRMNYNTKSNVKANYGEDVANWLFADGRKSGDVDTFEGTSANSTYVVYFDERDDLDYDTANIKILKINVDSTEEPAEGEEAKEPALDRFTAIWNEFQADPTEAKLDELIEKYSEDANKASDKGEKTNVNKLTYATEGELTSWLFNVVAKHNEGDFQKFENETSGFYIVWFKGYGENYRHQSVNSALTSEKQENWYESIAHVNEFVVDEAQIAHMRTGITVETYFGSNSNN